MLLSPSCLDPVRTEIYPRGHSLLNGRDGHQALRFDFFEPIIMLFNLNETTIKRLLELKMSPVKHWDLITVYMENMCPSKLTESGSDS